MPTITVEPETYERLEAFAEEKQANTEQIAQEAFDLYFWEQNNRKISYESAQYRKQHLEIKKHYLGQFIAMHQGKIVDTDSDFQNLNVRIRERFGNTAVLITKVEEAPETILHRRGVRYQ
jgi:ABC-type antimicrobial peptide transport system ATPase subunit